MSKLWSFLSRVLLPYQLFDLTDEIQIDDVVAALLHHRQQDGVAVVVDLVDVHARHVEKVLGDSRVP